MLDSVRKHAAAIPHVPARAVWSIATLASFGWLLSQDMVHPLVIYVMQFYLTF